MTKYIPFSGATASFIANIDEVKDQIELESENLLRLVNSNQVQLPTRLSELDRETVDIIDLSVDTALALRIPFGATDNKLSRRVFIQEYKKYKEITQGTDTLHCGISIRWIVNIKKLNASADVSSLPMVTASAQFNNLSASVRFEVVGISSSEITGLLPSNVDLKADTYVELKNAFEKIKSKIWETNTTILPAILGVFGTIKSEEEKVMNDAVAIAYALKKIKDGRNLQKALSDIASKPETVKDIVKSVYSEINKSSSLTADVTASAKDKAKQILNDLL
jgi:hypothetical protein